MSDPDVRRGREGSRWYNQRPTAEEVAEWFYTVRLADGMLHPDYISGITLISAKEKSDEVFNFDSDGLPLIRERQDLVFIPYVKVDTRVAYFWNLIDHHAEQGWVGTIDPVTTPASETLGLPPGFFKYAATDPKGKAASFVGCSMRVKVVAGDGKLVMHPPPGTKIVSTATKWDVDQNAVMKAETGAVGRALGMAGMLVVPGSGVATAEDMADNNVPAGAAAEPVLPATAVELTDDQLRDRATDLVAELSRLSRPKLEEYQEWARGRGLVLTQAQGPVLKGAVKKLEKTIAELEEAMAGV
jgi:hypothetical protein